MTDGEILAAIAEIVRTQFGVQRQIGMDTRLVEAFALDSLRLLTLVAEVENHFRVRLEDGDEGGLVTMADVVAVVRRHLP